MFTIFLHSLGITQTYSSKSMSVFILLVSPSKEKNSIHPQGDIQKPTFYHQYFKRKAAVLCHLLLKYTDSCSALQGSPMDECIKYVFRSVYGSFYVYFQGNIYVMLLTTVFLFYFCFNISPSVLYFILCDPTNGGKVVCYFGWALLLAERLNVIFICLGC